MSNCVLSKLAAADVKAIWDYVADDADVKTADQIGDAFIDAFERLAAAPGIGHSPPDVADQELRFFPVNRFVIAYVPDVKPLQIVRVLGGRRDFRKLFGK